MDTINIIIEILHRAYRKEATTDSYFHKDLQMDVIAMYDLFDYLEREHKIIIDDDYVGKMSTVKKFAEYIDKIKSHK